MIFAKSKSPWFLPRLQTRGLLDILVLLLLMLLLVYLRTINNSDNNSDCLWFHEKRSCHLPARQSLGCVSIARALEYLLIDCGTSTTSVCLLQVGSTSDIITRRRPSEARERGFGGAWTTDCRESVLWSDWGSASYWQAEASSTECMRHPPTKTDTLLIVSWTTASKSFSGWVGSTWVVGCVGENRKEEGRKRPWGHLSLGILFSFSLKWWNRGLPGRKRTLTHSLVRL